MPTHAADSLVLTGAGSSAAAPIYRSWGEEYQKKSGISLAYESIGSSAGIKKIQASQTGFGASDVAPPLAELKKNGLVLFPIAITGIAPVINLPKVGDAQLHLSGPVLGQIYLGLISQWNDPAIAQLNPELNLPALAIKVVVRSDGSGTTYNFADYLAKVNPLWKEKQGVKTSFVWPAQFLASKGSEGVVNAVKETVGAIGYVDYGYVKVNKLRTVQLVNAEGDLLAPSIGAFRAALHNSDWGSSGTFASTLTNMPGKGTWPITMGTFVLVPQVAQNAELTRQVLQFFVWAFINGDTLVQQNNFVRLPDRIQALAFKAISSVKDPAGKTLNLSLK
ncbi:MAG: phosphate ABC transporter substrate-binding protein PstS [Rhodoferax sp.]|uniref:phosphate ABC transporter substrate-binding protein PstS n=1 Tax=Rhodoferax sp. TaxID=50421 RepID=UPI003019DE25